MHSIYCVCTYLQPYKRYMCVYDCRKRRKCKSKNWRRAKGINRPEQYTKRKQIQDERERQRTITRIADCKTQLYQLENLVLEQKSLHGQLDVVVILDPLVDVHQQLHHLAKMVFLRLNIMNTMIR